MVGPALLSNPTRVFARLTYTGEDKLSPPICCDLSRVATIAAAHPLPKNLGFISRNNMSNQSGAKKINAVAACPTSHDGRTGNALRQMSATHSNGSKRSNPFTGNDSSSPAAKAQRTDTNMQERRQIKLEERRQASNLLAENEQLRKQNEILKKKLEAFQRIILQQVDHNKTIALKLQEPGQQTHNQNKTAEVMATQ